MLVVSGAGLSELSSRPSLINYCRQLWQRRHFILEDAKAKALRSTRDYRLWRLWLVVNPLFDVVLYGFLFGFLFKTSRGIDNFIGWLFIGIIYMRMLVSLFTSGSGLLTSNRAMIRTFHFPRVSVVFSSALRQSIDNTVPGVVALVAAFLLQWGKLPTWTTLLVIPLFVLMHIFGTGLMMILARITAEISDVKVVVPLISQAWFFLSGVMFSLERFNSNPTVKEIMMLNPAHTFLTAVRDTTIYGQAPTFDVWIQLFVWSASVFLLGFIFFWAAEEKYIRIA
ncbi:ABC transporter permease [Corynebacterium sp. H130]|uniref:ABC transporter permease n=1 Tax=Corynebacterium sp. H130 TaxID=3133444 RepID=UPI0030ACE813